MTEQAQKLAEDYIRMSTGTDLMQGENTEGESITVPDLTAFSYRFILNKGESAVKLASDLDTLEDGPDVGTFALEALERDVELGREAVVLGTFMNAFSDQQGMAEFTMRETYQFALEMDAFITDGDITPSLVATFKGRQIPVNDNLAVEIGAVAEIARLRSPSAADPVAQASEILRLACQGDIPQVLEDAANEVYIGQHQPLTTSRTLGQVAASQAFLDTADLPDGTTVTPATCPIGEIAAMDTSARLTSATQ